MKYVLSVSEINAYIKELISRDLILSNLWISGELSNFKYHYSGHMYFTLKDQDSLIKCVMFKTHNSNLKFTPENGMKVIIKGYVSVYERDGQYQLYAEAMQPDGIGNLHMAFEQLKKKLEDEGLFSAVHKKKIPFMPRSIGVITSSTGAVIRDIINVLSRRHSNIDLKIFPVAVQGEMASRQIAGAVRKFNSMKSVDVIIIARGGGSLEELWAFNEETVARSIFESEIPVISAVGHETDFTICDFVADLRAPTPAAAEIVMPEKIVLQNTIAALEARLKNSLLKNVRLSRSRHERLINRPAFKQPYNRVYQERMRLDVLTRYLHKGLAAGVDKNQARLAVLAGKLDALSPLTVLSRGYSVVKSKTKGNVIKKAADVKIGEEIEINIIDGKVNCTVNGIEMEGTHGQK